MRRLGLVACCSTKREVPAPAGDLYVSALFRLARRFVERECDDWRILSAKYGLLDPATLIPPYNETLKAKKAWERLAWARSAWRDLAPLLAPWDEVVVLAGTPYREHLLPLIEAHGCSVRVPMAGLTIGRQLQWLSQQGATQC